MWGRYALGFALVALLGAVLVMRGAPPEEEEEEEEVGPPFQVVKRVEVVPWVVDEKLDYEVWLLGWVAGGVSVGCARRWSRSASPWSFVGRAWPRGQL